MCIKIKQYTFKDCTFKRFLQNDGHFASMPNSIDHTVYSNLIIPTMKYYWVIPNLINPLNYYTR